MFRKPKRKIKTQALRKKDNEHEDVTDDDSHQQSGMENFDDDPTTTVTTSDLLQEARKRVRSASAAAVTTSGIGMNKQQSTSRMNDKSSVLHSFATSKNKAVTAKDLVTSTADHHRIEQPKSLSTVKYDDGIFRNDQPNKFHAGPIRAATNVRVTARFDYQPDVCKDYKETGFCGFGDTCIYLHDRGDTLSGWQLEQQWEQEQKAKREQQQQEMQDYAAGRQQNSSQVENESDGLPFACHLCRDYFKQPVATNCGHYFCEACIMHYVRSQSENCPICGKDTGSVFNQSTKLITKKRKVLGLEASKADDSWERYFKKQSQ